MLRRLPGAGLGLILVLLSLTTSAAAAAQGFTPPEGTLWTKFGVLSHLALDTFAGLDEVRFEESINAGDRVPFYSVEGDRVGGNLQIYELTGDVIYVPIRGLRTSFSAPLFKYVRYHNDVNDYTTQAFGPGDINLGAGYQWSPDSWNAYGSSVTVRAKIPTSFDLPYQNSASLGDGQMDVGAGLDQTFKVGPLLLDAGVTYLHRRPFTEGNLTIEPGDELQLQVALGGSIAQNVWAKVGYSGRLGETWTSAVGDEPASALIQPFFHGLFSSIYWTLSNDDTSTTDLDIWFQAPIAGQDAAILWSTGVGYVWAPSL